MREFQSQYRNKDKNIIIYHNKNEIPYICVPHLHSQYEIYYNISGAKGFMLDGEFYRCGERDLIVIPRACAHKVLVRKNVEYERCIININDYIVEMIEILCASKSALSWLKCDDGKSPEMVNLSEKQHKVFMKYIKRYNEHEQNNEELEAFSDFMVIMAFLKRCYENPRRADYIDENELSEPDNVMRMIERNFKTISVAEIAERICINEDYANRVFRKETGTTIQSYLTQRKIAEAKKYIFLGKSVKEACYLSGFRDYANFLRTFKKYEGYSPGELDELTSPL